MRFHFWFNDTCTFLIVVEPFHMQAGDSKNKSIKIWKLVVHDIEQHTLTNVGVLSSKMAELCFFHQALYQMQGFWEMWEFPSQTHLSAENVYHYFDALLSYEGFQLSSGTYLLYTYMILSTSSLEYNFPPHIIHLIFLLSAGTFMLGLQMTKHTWNIPTLTYPSPTHACHYISVLFEYHLNFWHTSTTWETFILPNLLNCTKLGIST